ncbi:MAG TPA: F0F1 ATP synthase subunit A [Gemmatimonadales bacterium]|nr:F0F1 ATP synthase subunit A [Gemmatimonadales bacterium]
MIRNLRSLLFIGALLAYAGPLAAQEGHEAGASETQVDIMHHLGNSDEIELPYWKAPYSYPVRLPHFAPIKVGPVLVDLSPTKHTVFLVLAAVLVLLVFTLTGRAARRARAAGTHTTGFAGAMEAMVLYIRNEVILPNVGHHGEKFVPYLLTIFFFILTCNLLGLMPWGATATGNIAVTASLALLTFLTIELAGMKELGFKGYLGTIFYLPHGLPTVLKPVMLVIMTPVEIIGKLSKPFALAVRLFANMTAGHVLVLALLGLPLVLHSYTVGVLASGMATAIMLLELFVAFLQAFVFTLLSSVFIGLIRAEH